MSKRAYLQKKYCLFQAKAAYFAASQSFQSVADR